MIWLAVKLALGKALRTFLDLARAYPWQCALAASLALSGWFYMGRQSARDELAAFKAAQAVATAKAIAARKAEEARHVERARRIDDEHKTELADAMDAADAYIRAHRVQCPRATSGTVTAATDRDTGIPEGMPAASVMVSEGDLRACTGAAAYAVKAREWALGLNE